MASSIGAWLAHLATQIVSPATSLVSAEITPVRDKSAFPCAFISAESGEINLDIKTVLDARFEVTIAVTGKSAEQVWTALEELLVLLNPYTTANTMYAHGVNYVAPLRWGVPKGDDAGINEYIEGSITYEFRVRYAY